MATVAQLWRHPIKSHGREALDHVSLSVGKCVPWDRHWAVIHEATKFDGSGWVMCHSFMIGNRTPALAGIWATLDEAAATMTLRHADLPDLTFRPDEDEGAFLKWVSPICPENRARPTGIVSVPDRGMTDTDYASVSIMNLASNDVVSDHLGHTVEPERWRGNIWLRDLPAWSEFDLIGKTIRVGTAEIEIREPIERCMHPSVNPHSGKRDADTLGALKAFGHQDFGVYGVVTKQGDLHLGDIFEVL